MYTVQRLNRRRRSVRNLHGAKQQEEAEHGVAADVVHQQQTAMAEQVVAMDALLQEHSVRKCSCTYKHGVASGTE